jgi:hypothetical protein
MIRDERGARGCSAEGAMFPGFVTRGMPIVAVMAAPVVTVVPAVTGHGTGGPT